eukprot:939749-Amphidinium_carterae.1
MSTPLPDDHWVSAWQIAASTGHTSLDAAERMLSRNWLMSTEDLLLPAYSTIAAEYVEVLLVSVFWTGLLGTPVSSCLVATHADLCSHRPDFQSVVLEGFGEGANTPMQLGVFSVPGEVLTRFVEGVGAGVATTPLMSSTASDANIPSGADVFNALILPASFSGGVCAYLSSYDGGLMMQVEGMAINDE